MSRIRHNDGSWVSVEISDGVYALGKMLLAPYVVFIDKFNDSHSWSKVDYSSAEELFLVACSEHFGVVNNAKRVTEFEIDIVIDSPRRFIQTDGHPIIRTIWPGSPRELTIAYQGSKREPWLVERDFLNLNPTERFKTKKINRLNLQNHKSLIERYDIGDTLTSWERLKERLKLSRLAGKSVDPLKTLVFATDIPNEHFHYMKSLEVPTEVRDNAAARGILVVDSA